MSRNTQPPYDLRITKRPGHKIKKSGPIRLNETPCEQPDKSARLADRLVTACRENVRFLNFHLSKYEKFLELPALVDNALYLAYTIRVREESPIEALAIRRYLSGAGIETSPAFSFVPSPEDSYSGPAVNRIREHSSRNSLDSRAFCLGCHQYLAILDLEHIIDTFETIFHPFDKVPSSFSEDIDQRGKF